MSRFSCLVLTLLVSSLLPTAALPQDSTTQGVAPRDAQAAALVSQATRALTGDNEVGDITLTARVIRIAGPDLETGRAVLKARTSGESRIDLSFASGERSDIQSDKGDPQGAWIDREGKSKAIAPHNRWTDTAWFSPAVLLSSLASRAEKGVVYAGREDRNGQQVEHLLIWRQLSRGSEASRGIVQRLSQVELFLAADSLLPTALTFSLHPDDDSNLDISVEIRFSDYRQVSGVLVPFRIQKYVNGGLVQDFFIDAVAVNSRPPDSDFAVPATEGGDL